MACAVPSVAAPSVSRIIVAIAPGPAMSGRARGKTEGSVVGTSARPSRLGCRFSNSISSAVRNSSSPPAIRKAGMEMPRKVRIDSPSSAKAMRMPTLMRQARRAMVRRAAAVMPAVMATKMGARPMGSITTKSAVKAVTSSI